MEILVVGAGIAGPTLAYWLLQGGHDVTLVERAPELRRGGYLIDFWGAGFDVAERMGIVPALRAKGHELREARSVTKRGRRIGSLDPSAFLNSTHDRYVSIARSDLAALVFGAVQGRVELILDDTVQAVEDDGNRVRVRFESAQPRAFDLVVGADGLHSRVRRLVFGPDAAYEKNLGLVVAAFDVVGYPRLDDGVAMMHAGVGFQVVRLALRDAATMFLLTLRHTGAVPSDLAGQHRLLREHLRGAGWETADILDVLPRADTFYFDSVSQIRMPSWTRGRVALVGDAAACPTLLAGQGSALAMVEAYVLAAELAASDGDHRAAFAGYQQLLADFVRAKQDAAEGLRLGFAPKNRWELVVRNAMIKAMGQSWVADLAMGRSLRDSIELPAFSAV